MEKPARTHMPGLILIQQVPQSPRSFPPRRSDLLFLQVTHLWPSDMHAINVPCSFVNQCVRHRTLEGNVQMTSEI